MLEIILKISQISDLASKLWNIALWSLRDRLGKLIKQILNCPLESIVVHLKMSFGLIRIVKRLSLVA